MLQIIKNYESFFRICLKNNFSIDAPGGNEVLDKANKDEIPQDLLKLKNRVDGGKIDDPIAKEIADHMNAILDKTREDTKNLLEEINTNTVA